MFVMFEHTDSELDGIIHEALAEGGTNRTAAELSFTLQMSLDRVERSLSRLADAGAVRSGFGSGGYEAVGPWSEAIAREAVTLGREVSDVTRDYEQVGEPTDYLDVR